MAVLVAVLLAAEANAALVNGIKAVVHDSAVTYDQVEQLTEQTADELVRDLASKPAELQKRLNAVRGENLEKLMDRELILHEFKTAGYSLPESVLEDLVQERIKTRYGDRRRLTQTLQAQGMTFEKFKQQVKDQFIVEALRSKNIASEILISPYKMEKYYQENQDRFKMDDQVKLSLIVLVAKDSNREQARQLANEIHAKLKEGATFFEMASIYSQGAERTLGGQRPMQEMRTLRDELSQAASKLQPGEFSDVIDTGDAVWLVKLDERIVAHVKPITEVRDEIEKDLLAQERNRLEKQWIERLRKKTFVRYF